MARYDFDLGDNRKQKKMKKRILGLVLLLLETVAVIGLAFLAVQFSLERTVMSGDSMAPTLEEDTSIMVSKLSYMRKGPERFDVIVFKQAGEEHNYYQVRRVIGLPGETVQITDEVIYINGEPLEESYGSTVMGHAGIASEPITLGEKEYFVLGDNRAISKDSRSESVGVVPLSRVGGKLMIRIFPFDKFGTVNE